MTVRATAANPAVLRWAREGLGLTTGQVAEKMSRPIEVIEAWEAGVESPTFNQLERLADVVYKRPVAVFFFPEPPEEEDLQTEFRTLPGREFEKLERDTRLALREARGYQISLAELAGGTNPRDRLITRDLDASLDEPLLDLVSRVRGYLGVSLEEQKSWRDPTDAFKKWREAVEVAGVFVFKRAFEQREISGFCLSGPEFPIILINNSTPHTRQIFTLFHELAHLLFGISGITTSDPHFEEVFTGRSREIEVRCNRFAAEFLVPRESFSWDVLDALSLDEAVSRIADRFNVSREVILRRLLDEGRIARTTYEQKARRWIDQAQETRSRGSSGGNYYANQATYLGDAFLELGFSQYHAGNVTLSELADHFGMRAPIVSRLESYLLSRRQSMVYVFDSNSFGVLKNFYPAAFPTFWEHFDALVDDGRVVSVREVRKELVRRSDSEHLDQWIEDKSSIFQGPTEAELQLVGRIFEVSHFQQMIGRTQLLKGYPVADPFIVARAWDLDGCVVTEERHKPNAAQIPNVCEHFDVEWTNVEGFLTREGLSY